MSTLIERLNKEDVELAKEAQRCLMTALDHSRALSIALVEDGVERLDGAPLLKLPPQVLRLFAEMLGVLAQGKPVSIVPKQMEVTTQEAAMLLNVSRPYVVRLLEEGKIQFHKVGTHRRIRYEDLMEYKEQRSKASQAALQELADQAQAFDMGY